MTWYAAYKLFYSSSIWRIWIIFAPLPLLSYASPYFHIKYAHKCFIDFTPIHISSTSANFVNGLNACLPVWMCWCLPFRLHCLLRRQMTSIKGYANTECEQRLRKHIPRKADDTNWWIPLFGVRVFILKIVGWVKLKINRLHIVCDHENLRLEYFALQTREPSRLHSA